MLIDGVMLLWFMLTALSVAFVALDIRATPEHPVMKRAFGLFTAYSVYLRSQHSLAGDQRWHAATCQYRPC